MRKLKLGVLISGRGSNLQALIEASEDADYPARIVLVVSNERLAQGLDRAEKAGIPTAVIGHLAFEDREEFDAQIDETLKAHGVELVCLAGFMRLLGAGFVDTWRDRLINTHPSLLPSFKGANAIADTLAAGVKLTGCTLHYVRAAMDDGPIISQTVVAILPGDDEETLSARIREAEHASYTTAVRLIAEGRVRVVDEKVTIEES